MKILFSSDWHLGYELGGANRQPRLGDQLRNLRRIAAYCDEHDVDVLAVAGDVFEAQEKGRARAVVAGMMDALAAPLARGMRLIAIAGNHDRDFFMETANLWLSAGAAPSAITLVTRPQLLTVDAHGERVNFALLPFPTPDRYALKADENGSAGERNVRLATRFCEEMERIRDEAAAMRLPTVLLTHVTVEGTDVGAHRISPRDDITIPQSRFPSFELTVVGHIHKAEKRGGGHFYYVGVLDRMDIGERGYEPRVLLADIGPQGVRDVASLPLDPTPFADLVAHDEDSLRTAADGVERIGETLVRLTLEVPYGTYTGALTDLARQLFPRLYGNIEHAWTEVDESLPDLTSIDPADVRGNIRNYIEQNARASERDALLAIVDELLAEREAAL